MDSTASAARLNSEAGTVGTVNTTDQEKMGQHGVENVPRAPTKTQKARAHVLRHKWVYLAGIIALVVVIILVPVILCVIIPRMIQNGINSNGLPIHNATLRAVSPTVVSLGMTTELDNPRAQTITLDAFDVELYNPDAPNNAIITVPFPEQVLEGHKQIALTIEPQDRPVLSQEQLKSFLGRAFNATKAAVGVRGSTRAHLGSLSYAVTIDKVTEIDALAGLPDMKVMSLNPTAPDLKADATNRISVLNGSISLPNPSQLTLDLGDVHYTVSSGGAVLGKSWTKALHVVPGDQTIDYQGEMNVDDIVDEASGYQNFAALLGTLGPDGRVHFDIVGDRAYSDGQPITYLDDVVKQISLKVAPCYSQAAKAVPLSMQKFELAKFSPGGIEWMLASDCDSDDPLP